MTGAYLDQIVEQLGLSFQTLRSRCLPGLIPLLAQAGAIAALSAPAVASRFRHLHQDTFAPKSDDARCVFGQSEQICKT